jgi:ABC-type polysaccharide/polyol phosphate export permease
MNKHLRTIIQDATQDVAQALTKKIALVGMLGWQDLRQRYRRSSLGPFWISLSMGVMIATIGIVFGQIFNSPMQEYLPFLACGIILWAYIASVLNEGCTAFIDASAMIKQLNLPFFAHIARMTWRNFLIFTHNIVILPLVFIMVLKPLSLIALLSIPGMLLLTINLGWIALILAVLCTRYRDLSQMVTSILQVLFYLTPVMWMPSLVPARANLYLLDLNPAYHLIQIVRAPILGQAPSTLNWVVSITIAIVGWIVALIFFGHYKKRIAYWL